MKKVVKKLLAGFLILIFVYGTLKVVFAVGVWYVLSFFYLLLGFMIGWETRQGQGHRLWPLVVVGWLPLIVWGLTRRGKGLVTEINEKVAEREVGGKS